MSEAVIKRDHLMAPWQSNSCSISGDGVCLSHIEADCFCAQPVIRRLEAMEREWQHAEYRREV